MIFKTLKIAMICDPITDFTAGGTISTLRFAEFLRQKGHTVIFVASKSPSQECVTSHRNFKIYRFPSIVLPKNEGQFRMSFPTPKQITRVLKQEHIDLVHFMLPHPAAIASLRAARSTGARVVAHSHTQSQNIIFRKSNKPQSLIDTMINRYLAWLYNQADAVVFPSEFARDLLRPYLKQSTKAVVISNGVDTIKFRPIAVTENETPPRSRQSSTLLFVGRLHPEKAVDVLIEAAALVAQHHPEVNLSVVGRGYLDKQLQILVRNLHMEDRVTFHGLITEEELILAYNACSLFVSPSWAELEGMAVLEAMACGKPIVTANSLYSASRFFVDGNGLLFIPGDAQDLASKLLALLSDPDKLNDMGRISRHHSELYDIRISADQLENLYFSLLNSGQSVCPAA